MTTQNFYGYVHQVAGRDIRNEGVQRQWRELSELDSRELGSLRQLEYEGWKEARRRESFHWGILAFPIVGLVCLWLFSVLPLTPQLFGLMAGTAVAVVLGSNIARLRHEADARFLVRHHAARINAIDDVLRRRVD